MKIKEEIWKRVGHLNYWVSNLGKVKNSDEHIIATVINPISGYEQIRLVVKRGVSQTFYMHRLVAEAFIPNPCNYNEVNHINEIRTDNRAANLEWCTHKYNSNYGNHSRRVSESQRKGANSKRIPVWIIFPDGHKEFAHSLREASEITSWNRGTIQRRLENPDAIFKKNTYKFEYVDSNKKTKNKGIPRYKEHEQDRIHNISYSEITARIRDKFPTIEVVGRARGVHNTAKFKCNSCGYSFNSTPFYVLNSRHGCPKCALKIRTEKRRSSRQEVEQKISVYLYDNLILGDDYIAMHEPCSFKCKNCGKEFKTVPVHLINRAKQPDYMGNGCQACSKRRAITIRNLRRYGHSDSDIIQNLKDKNLDWTLQR